MLPEFYDATTLNNFRRCPDYGRRSLLGWRLPVYEGATASGQAAHKALQYHFSRATTDVEGTLKALRDTWTGPDDPLRAQDEKRPLELFELILQTYCEVYQREADPFEVVANERYVEATIEATSPPNYCTVIPWCAVQDRKVRFEDGAEYVMDAKFTAMYLGEQFFRKFDLSTQLLGNVAIERVLGRQCDGFYIDAVHVDTRYGKAHAKYFQRYGPVRVPDWKLTEWAKGVEADIRQIERYVDDFGFEQPWPRWDGGCGAFNKLCPYFRLCNGPPELEPYTLEDEYEVKVWNPKEVASNA